MTTLFYYISIPFGWLMKGCLAISGQNYLIALIFFTLIIQVLLCLIFGIKQQKNMQKDTLRRLSTLMFSNLILSRKPLLHFQRTESLP